MLIQSIEAINSLVLGFHAAFAGRCHRDRDARRHRETKRNPPVWMKAGAADTRPLNSQSHAKF